MSVRALDSAIPVYELLPMEDVVARAVAGHRFNATLMAAFAAVALALAAVGIYGVVSYAVVRRVHEIGMRMALGAPASRVLGGVVRDGMKPVAAGVALGLPATYGLMGLLESLLFGIGAADVTTYAALAATLTAVGLAATWIPARRVLRADHGGRAPARVNERSRALKRSLGARR